MKGRKQNVDNTEQPKGQISHISLCYGYGGIDLGLHRVYGDRIRAIALCEIEAFACENALAKMEAGILHPAPIWNDLRTFPWADFRDEVDVLSGGFPCQPFSAAGKRNADSDPRHLFPAILEGIRICRPAFVFLENVEGIVSAKLKGDGWRDKEGTPVLLHVCRELERVGYRATWGIFSASEVGAPHQRKRVFILAHSDRSRNAQSGLFDTDLLAEPGSELAHSAGIGGKSQPAQRQPASERVASMAYDCCDVWPSRPGEEQRGWEPARVVDAKGGESKLNAMQGRSEGGKRGEHTLGSMLTSADGGEQKVVKSASGESAGDTAGEGSQKRPPRCVDSSIQTTQRRSGSEDERQTQPSLGRNPDGPSDGLDLSELSGLGDSELAEIYEWMERCDNRTDELRLLGNGVVMQTAELAWRTLYAELMEQSP